MSDWNPKQEAPYGLRMPPDLKARVKAAAEANNRSMNAEIVALLEERFPAPPTKEAISTALLRMLETIVGREERDWDRTVALMAQKIGLEPSRFRPGRDETSVFISYTPPSGEGYTQGISTDITEWYERMKEEKENRARYAARRPPAEDDDGLPF